MLNLEYVVKPLVFKGPRATIDQESSSSRREQYSFCKGFHKNQQQKTRKKGIVLYYHGKILMIHYQSKHQENMQQGKAARSQKFLFFTCMLLFQHPLSCGDPNCNIASLLTPPHHHPYHLQTHIHLPSVLHT